MLHNSFSSMRRGQWGTEEIGLTSGCNQWRSAGGKYLPLEEGWLNNTVNSKRDFFQKVMQALLSTQHLHDHRSSKQLAGKHLAYHLVPLFLLRVWSDTGNTLKWHFFCSIFQWKYVLPQNRESDGVENDKGNFSHCSSVLCQNIKVMLPEYIPWDNFSYSILHISVLYSPWWGNWVKKSKMCYAYLLSKVVHNPIFVFFLKFIKIICISSHLEFQVTVITAKQKFWYSELACQ